MYMYNMKRRRKWHPRPMCIVQYLVCLSFRLLYHIHDYHTIQGQSICTLEIKGGSPIGKMLVHKNFSDMHDNNVATHC